MKKIILLTTMILVCSFAIAQKGVKWQSVKYNKYESIDFSKPVHSFGFSFFGGINFAPKPINTNNGPLTPQTFCKFTPEFTVQYTCILKEHFGFSLEIPFGLFQRHALADLSAYGKEDVYIEVGSPYIGFTPKLSYFTNIGKNVGFQADFGVKFMPFSFPNDYWITTFTQPNENNFAHLYHLSVPAECYFIPDATCSIMFFIHGKKNPHNNFVIGLTGNLSFVKRMIVSYDTFKDEATLPDFVSNESPLPIDAYTYGHIGWNSSSIGITIGYRFMDLRP